jgi:hypothetical protein
MIAIELICVDPPLLHGEDGAIEFGLQDKAQRLQAGAPQADGALRFDTPVQLKPGHGDALPDFVGPFVHGPRGDRFLYLSLRGADGQWIKRIKIPLTAITSAQLDQVMSGGGCLSATISGARAARAKLLGDGWTIYGA